MKKIDLTGMTFGRLTAVKRIAAPYEHTRYLCRCECGSEPTVLQTHLQRGNTKSCGCLNREVAVVNLSSKKHGMWKSREFAIWTGMLARCYNKNHHNYPRYGGRGISVCDEWKDSFLAFYMHMGERPTSKHTLERIDNDVGYMPGNVRWATAIEQANNKCNNLRLTDTDGERMTASQLARKHGLKVGCVIGRVRSGYSGKELILPPGELLREQARPSKYSDLPGAHWCKQQEVWKSSIQYIGKVVHLGTFDSAQSASAAYVNAKERIRNGGTPR